MVVLVALWLSAGDAVAPPVTAPPPPAPIQVDAAALAWKDAPASMPKGTQIAVLEGDPTQTGWFTIRLKAPKGFALPLHTHPAPERVTVLEGSISVSFNAGLDKKTARTFSAGAFYVNPPDVPHFVFSDDGCVVQITGVGPWKVVTAAPSGKLLIPPK